MDRLTFRDDFNEPCYHIGNTTYKNAVSRRLAAYEDTGLEPEEIEQTLKNFATILSYVTNNHMSKINYTVEAMKCEINDCWQKECDECEDRGFAEKYRNAEEQGRLIVLPEKMTNADRIRAMSDEELAVWTMKVLLPDDTIPFCQNKPECEKALDAGDEIEDAECIGCLLEWLRQPAEGGEQERAYRVDNFRDCRKKEANRMALIDGDVRRINHE